MCQKIWAGPSAPHPPSLGQKPKEPQFFPKKNPKNGKIKDLTLNKGGVRESNFLCVFWYYFCTKNIQKCCETYEIII